MFNDWPYFVQRPAPSSALVPHHLLPLLGPGGADGPGSQLSCAEEFPDFSATRRSHRRRIACDTVASVRAPVVDEGDDFDHLDDDQLTSMLPSSSSGIPASSSATPSEHNSVHGRKRAADQLAAAGPEEAQSRCNTEPEATTVALPAPGPEPILDPKRVRRILANRQSAQRSRVRKLQYISELERSVARLQTKVSALSPRVAFLNHQRSVLTMGNGHLKQLIAALAQDNIFKDAHQEALKKELERLRRVYHQQNLDKMAASSSEPVAYTEKLELF